MSEVEPSQDEKGAKSSQKKQSKHSRKVTFKIIKRAIRPDQRRVTADRIHEFQRTIAIIITAAVVLLFGVAITYITPIMGKADYQRGSAGLTLHNDLLFIPAYGNGTVIVDVSDPSDPTEAGYVHEAFQKNDTREAMAVAVSEYEATPENRTIVFIGDWEGTVRIVDITDRDQVQELAKVKEPGMAFLENMEVAKGHLFVQSCEVTVFDVQDPAQPIFVSTIKPSSTCAGDIFIRDGLLYLGHQGLKIYDISEPSNASLMGQIALEGPIWTVKVEGDNAYVAAGVKGFYIVDVSDPVSPQLLSSKTDLSPVNDLQPYGEYLYVSVGHKGLQLFDIFDPRDPELVNDRFHTDYTFKVQRDEDHLYVLDRDSKLRVLALDSDGDGHPIGADAYPPLSFLHSRWQGFIVSLVLIGLFSMLILRYYRPPKLFRPGDSQVPERR